MPALPRLFPLCLAVALAITACKREVARTGGRPANALFTVDVVRVAPQPFEQTLSATGTLRPNEAVQMQFERAGILDQIGFKEGAVMKKGEVIAELDDLELAAELARAEAQLGLATAQEERQKNLLRNKGISDADYDQSRANLNIAVAARDLVKAQIEKTQIRAPFDGVAGLRQVSVGAYVSPGTTICSFQDISKLKLDFSLPERYLPYIEAGQKVSFQITGRSEKYEATITALEPTVDVATRSLTVRAIASNEGQRLYPGAFAEIKVALEKLGEAILIPAIALVPGLKNQTIFIHRDGVVEERKVQPGLRTTDAVQIVEGLKAGDEVVVSGVLQLRSGMKVNVTQREPSELAPETQKATAAEKAS